MTGGQWAECSHPGKWFHSKACQSPEAVTVVTGRAGQKESKVPQDDWPSHGVTRWSQVVRGEGCVTGWSQVVRGRGVTGWFQVARGGSDRNQGEGVSLGDEDVCTPILK